MSFMQKAVHDTDGIGRDLEELRDRMGWTRVEAARVTKIGESTLRAWEEDDWAQFDDVAAVERMLRGYIQQLSGNVTFILQKFRERCVRKMAQASHQYLPKTRSVGRWDLVVGPRLLTLFFFLGFVGMLAGYVYFQARTITEPPPLEVFEPMDGSQVSQPTIRVVGKTMAEAEVIINGKKSVVQQDGSFSEELSIPRGITTIFITAKRRHSEETVVTRRIRFDRE